MSCLPVYVGAPHKSRGKDDRNANFMQQLLWEGGGGGLTLVTPE